jgi:hypothetical protein
VARTYLANQRGNHIPKRNHPQRFQGWFPEWLIAVRTYARYESNGSPIWAWVNRTLVTRWGCRDRAAKGLAVVFGIKGGVVGLSVYLDPLRSVDSSLI